MAKRELTQQEIEDVETAYELGKRNNENALTKALTRAKAANIRLKATNRRLWNENRRLDIVAPVAGVVVSKVMLQQVIKALRKTIKNYRLARKLKLLVKK